MHHALLSPWLLSNCWVFFLSLLSRELVQNNNPGLAQILLQNKYLDQQQVGEMAMIPPSDARERLYRLLRDRCEGSPLPLICTIDTRDDPREACSMGSPG